MITITLFSSNMLLSKIIQWFQGSKASHAAIGFEKDGKQYFLHAAWGGVQITPREVVLSNHTIVAEFEILSNFDDEVSLAKSKVGQPYDTIGLFGYIFVLISRKFNLGIHNLLASKSAVVCSEFVIELDVNNEIPEFYGLHPSDVMPRDLLEICTKGNSFKRITSYI